MGDSDTDKIRVQDSSITDSNIPKLIITLLLILAAFAPLAVTYYGYWSYSLTIVAILWMMSLTEFGMTFELVPTYALMTMFPFFLVRLALPYQINKYYKGRTTRGRTAVAAILADLPFIIIFVPSIIMSLMAGGIYFINAPVPIMMTVGLLILWRLPVPEPKVPWDGVERSKYWWEEEEAEDSTSEQPESPW